jgi:cobalamin synthase
VEPVIEPDHKSSPKRALIVLLFTVVGFFIGCLVALLAWGKQIVSSEPSIVIQILELKKAILGRGLSKQKG